MLPVLLSSDFLSAVVNRQGKSPPVSGQVSGKTSKILQWRLWESSRLHPVYVDVFPIRSRTRLSHKFLVSIIEQGVVVSQIHI